ncbi:hypothetical protein AJ78_00693 [Emergomyces pasteurianus Ep9510]|uniref:Rhodopsin domain-containing protein n=1 Tax=Emergomyces pasteurianus Ep9510 TaxID=1447872 RepID=A0A1J9PSU3_9EURO|nr:hypothetical protein AJ78_00693 [Emergomyces pasteurianus Ep9510]
MDDQGPPPDGDVNKGPMLNAITWAECGVALALVLARIITRTRLIQRWGWDDAFMCLAMACALVNTICVTICIHYGTGRHVYYLNDYQKVQANKFNWISQGFHVMSTNWGKVSIAFFLLRIVDRAKRKRYIFFGGMVLLTVVNSVCVYTIYGQCTPTTALWNGTGPNKKGSCWHPNIQRDYAFFQGSFSAASDLLLALYPVFIIWQLQMARNMKIGLTCVLALGVIATAAAIVKTIYLSELVARSDYTFETINLTTWISTEQYLIIIAACIPTLGPLFTATTGRTPSGRRAGSTPGYRPSGSHSRRYFHQGPNADGGSGLAFKKRAGSDVLTYNMDEFTTTTTMTAVDPWTRTPPRRSDDDGSEEAIIKDGAAEGENDDGGVRRGGGSGERSQSSRGIMKTMEVQVNSQNMERNRQRGGSSKNKVLLPWEPTSPT